MTVPITFPGESAEYRAARNALLEREIALRREMEAVAVERRALPPGPVVAEDYRFEGLGADGKSAAIHLSELFRDGTDTLLVYHYMFPRYLGDDRVGAATGETARLPLAEQPCPSCTALLDQLDAAAPHYEAGGRNFAVVADAPLERMLGVARDRGWRHLHLLSAAGTRFKRDCGALNSESQPEAMVSVFRRQADGTIRMFWASELLYVESEPGQHHRAAGTIEPFWNMFDLGPGGRPERFDEQMQYDDCCHR